MYILSDSNQARRAVAVGRENHWRFRTVGHGGLPEYPILKSEMLFETVPEYSIPWDARERIKAIKEAGLTTQGVIIAHEAPRILTAPKPKPKVDIDLSHELSEALGFIWGVSKVILTILGTFLLFELLIDPAVIVVLEDGTWLEVMRWYE